MLLVLLLRGINVGPHKRIAMPRLRELLAGGGYQDARTYVQSGNVVLRGAGPPDRVARECEALIAEGTGFAVEIVARAAGELAEVVRRDPLGKAVEDPKRYLVSFLSAEPDPAVVRELEGLAAGEERLVASGRELYAWFPDGAGRSKLAARMAGQKLGVTATARNWNTVTELHRMASG